MHGSVLTRDNNGFNLFATSFSINLYMKEIVQCAFSLSSHQKDYFGLQVYQGVFMNNVMGLATFLALVYIKDITWDVSAEVLVVLLICTLMGTITSFCTKFQFWMCILAYALYPVSLLLLYILTSVLGWS